MGQGRPRCGRAEGGSETRGWDGGRSGRPAPAFEEAASGSRGWGLRPADVAVAAATLLGAIGVCCVLWFGFGLQGVPGVEVNPAADATGQGGVASEEGAAGQAERGEGAPGADAAGSPGQVDGGATAVGAGADATAGREDLGLDAGGPAGSPDALQADEGAPASESDAAAGQEDLGLDAGASAGVSGAAQTDAGSSASVFDDADAARYAVVQTSEGFYQVLPLDEDATVTVGGSLGTNVVEVRDGRVRCEESDCSNQTCVNQGWVSGVGQTIVCLPHKLMVQVVADPADASPLK